MTCHAAAAAADVVDGVVAADAACAAVAVAVAAPASDVACPLSPTRVACARWSSLPAYARCTVPSLCLATVKYDVKTDASTLSVANHF